jgi:nicotinamide-nucleotide amidase
MEEVVGALLREKNLTLGTAESCTGGLIGNLLTDVPGSSAYFRGGVVVYGNRAKSDLLGVLPETVETYGAVSNETVGEMASGVRERLMADIGVAVSGIAGPDGGSEEKPVGTVHIGLASKNETMTRGYRFWGERGQIKRHSAIMALDWVRRYIHGNPFLPGV